MLSRGQICNKNNALKWLREAQHARSKAAIYTNVA